MKSRVTFVAVIIFLTELHIGCTQGSKALDQKALKAANPEPGQIVTTLIENDAQGPNIKSPFLGDLSNTIRYSLPARGNTAEKESPAKRWGVAAPVAGDFSDPNEIVYDQTYIDNYVEWAVNSPIICGSATYRVATAGGVIKFTGGLDESYLGSQFRADDLMRFLKLRTEGKTVDRTFSVNRQAAKANGRLSDSPWDRDTSTVVVLLASVRYKPAYPLFKALLHDPSPTVRSSAIDGLGAIAPAMPEAVKDLAHLLSDEKWGHNAANALAGAGGVAVPALVQAMDHPNWKVGNRAVFAFVTMRPFDDAAPGIVTALNHKDKLIRRCAVEVVIDLQGRGLSVARDDLIDALARLMAEGDADSRRLAAIALLNLKGAAARARPALVKAASEDREYMVSHYAHEALKAIDALAPQNK